MKKILVIDDEANFGQMIKINLEETGKYEVTTALNAMEGYQKIEQEKFDVIFLDILMPKIEGHVALQKIKEMCDTPVVMMSAFLPPQRRSAILEAGACDILEKPVDLDRILKTIATVTGD